MSHARLSPSARYRWQACPGSIREIARYTPAGGSSAGAIDGTHSHTLLEHCIKHSVEAKHYVGMVLTDHEGMFAVDRERAERVQVALDYIAARVIGTAATIKSEEQVDPSPFTGRDDMTGTVDVQIHFGTEMLEIIDYKDGINPVTAKDNPQLVQYVFGVLGNMMKEGTLPPFKWYRLTIIQPKLALKGIDPISSWDYTSDEIMGMLMPMVVEANATDDPGAPLVPGEKQCTYCPHRPNCQTFQQWSLEKAGIKFSKVPEVPPASPAEQAAGNEVVGMTDQQLREMIEAAPLIRKLLADAEEQAVARISAGKPIEGLKLVNGRGSRSWAKDEDATVRALTRMGVPKKNTVVTAIVSPAQAEKLRWTKKDGTEGFLTEGQVERLNKEYIKRSEGRLTVVSESDHRKAVDFGNLASMFSAVKVPPQEAATPAPVPSWLS